MANESPSVTENVDVGREVEAYLSSRLPSLLSAAARQVNIAQLAAAAGSIGGMQIDRIELGQANIDRITFSNVSATLNAGNALLSNVRVNLELQISLQWEVDVLWFERSGTESLGSLFFNVTVGDIQVPSLQQITMNIPAVSVDDIQANMTPITSLDLGAGNLEGFRATETTLPTEGFQLSGMGLGSFSLSSVQVPGTSTRQASLQRFRPQRDLVLPGAQLANVQVPSTSIPNIQSSNFAFDAVLSQRGLGIDLGILAVTVLVRPIAHMNIGAMVLGDLDLSATVGQASVENVRIPLDVRGIDMHGISLRNVTVNDVTG